MRKVQSNIHSYVLYIVVYSMKEQRNYCVMISRQVLPWLFHMQWKCTMALALWVCVCSEKIREKSRSKLAAFVRLFSSQFQLFSGWSSWSYEQGITCSDPFKKVAHLQLHCWLCTGSIMLGAVLLLNECDWVCVCVCWVRVSVAPIAMQCKVCEPLLIFARVESECELLNGRVSGRGWWNVGAGTGEWVNASVCFVHCRVTFLMKQQQIRIKNRIEWGQIWNSFTAKPVNLSSVAPFHATFRFIFPFLIDCKVHTKRITVEYRWQ